MECYELVIVRVWVHPASNDYLNTLQSSQRVAPDRVRRWSRPGARLDELRPECPARARTQPGAPQSAWLCVQEWCAADRSSFLSPGIPYVPTLSDGRRLVYPAVAPLCMRGIS